MDFEYSDTVYNGIEDIKLSTYNGSIYYTGTLPGSKGNSWLQNSWDVVYGIYNPQDGSIQNNVLEKIERERVEKNWVLLPEFKKIIYKWYPLEVYDIIDNKIVNCKSYQMPHIFRLARGTSNGFGFNNEIWFVVHFVHQYNDEKRYYYHMIVVFDNDLNLLNFTCPFKLSNKPIEFCCGIVVEEDRILLSHSVLDKESFIKIFNKKYIETFFFKSKLSK